MESRTYQLQWETGEGQPVPVFVRELHGGTDGPVLALIGGEHGIELTGPAAIDAACRDLAGEAFRGTVLAVPCIAPVNIAYRHHTLGQPRGQGSTYDMPYNSYARWPGNSAGDPADRLCALIWEQVILRAEVVLNFHAWGHISSSASCIRTADSRLLAMAHWMGLPFTAVDAFPQRSLAETANAHGKPAMLVELQAQWWINPHVMALARQGIRNVMAGLGMLDTPIVLPDQPYQVGPRECLVRAPHAGLFIPLRENAETVAAGDLLGYLLDIYTGARTDILAPTPGALWSIARQGPQPDIILEDMQAYADEGDLLVLIKEIDG